MGHQVEERLGRKRFTVLIVAMTVLPSLLVTILSFDDGYGAYGLSILGIALLCVFALDNPSAMFFFGIPAWVIAVIFVALDVLQYVGNRWWGVLVQLLLTCALALVVMRQFGELREEFDASAAGRPDGSEPPPPHY